MVNIKKITLALMLFFAVAIIASCQSKNESSLTGPEWSLQELDAKLTELKARDAKEWADPALIAGYETNDGTPVDKWQQDILKVENFLRKYPKKFVDYVEAYKNTARNPEAKVKFHMGLGGQVSTESKKTETWDTLVNDLNNLSGIGPVKERADVRAVAKKHSEASLAKNQGGHATVDATIEGGKVGDSPSDRFIANGLPSAVSENVYSGFIAGGLKSATDEDLLNISLDTIMTYLLDYNQPARGHRKNLLAAHSETGTGCAEKPGAAHFSNYYQTFCTNDFL